MANLIIPKRLYNEALEEMYEYFSLEYPSSTEQTRAQDLVRAYVERSLRSALETAVSMHEEYKDVLTVEGLSEDERFVRETQHCQFIIAFFERSGLNPSTAEEIVNKYVIKEG